MTNLTHTKGPLSGVTAISLCQAIAGPFASSMLGDFGANVIAIENPKGRDASRPSHQNPGWGTVMDKRNTQSLCMDVRTDDGRRIFKALLKNADMLIDGFRGGQLASWGFSDDDLWSINPALVIVHISGYGQTGDPSYVKRASFDGIGQAFSGFLEMNGYSDRPAIPAFPQVSDYYTGFAALAGGLAALVRAQATGVGDSVDVAQYEIMARCSGYYVMNYLNTGQLPQRGAVFNAGMGTYECQDGVGLYVMILGAGVLKKACEILDLKYGADPFPCGINGARKGTEAGEALEAALLAYLSEHDSGEAESAFQEAGIPCSLVNTFEMCEKNPQFLARKTFTVWRNAYNEETTRGVNVVPRFTKKPGEISRGMPLVGQDNEMILSALGIDEKSIKHLYDSGVISHEQTPFE